MDKELQKFVSSIRSADIYEAAEIAENSLPCTGSLKEFVTNGNGTATARCIMGCVYEGMARTRHRSFDEIEARSGGLDSETAHLLTKAAGVKTKMNLVTANDSFDVGPYSLECYLDSKLHPENYNADDMAKIEKAINKLRKYQVTTLTKIADGLAARGL